MTESAMTPESATALRKPFPPASVGKLPKGGALLDYVGHAAVTDRLLTVDPHWTWEPFALDESGLPKLDSKGNLWIKLTICGVTRLGVGDGKNAKEIIGDAIRNAAMRFGVALDLWAKEDLIEFAQAAQRATPPVSQPTPTPPVTAASPSGTEPLITPPQVKKLGAAMGNHGLTKRDDALRFVAHIIGHEVTSRNELTKAEASKIIDHLESLPAGADPWTGEVVAA